MNKTLRRSICAFIVLIFFNASIYSVKGGCVQDSGISKSEELVEKNFYPNLVIAFDIRRQGSNSLLVEHVGLDLGRPGYGGPHALLELLSTKEVRHELKLDESQLATLDQLSSLYHKYKQVYEFRTVVGVGQVKTDAIQQQFEVKQRIEESGLNADFLSLEQSDRLAQIWRRYALICGATSGRFVDVFLLERLGVSNSKVEKINAILDSEVSAWRKQVEGAGHWKEILHIGSTPDQIKKIDFVCDTYSHSARISPVIFAAQLNVDASPLDAAIEPGIVGAILGVREFRAALLLNGKLIPYCVYRHSPDDKARFPIRDSVFELCHAERSQYDWLQLVDWQMDDLKDLLKRDDRGREFFESDKKFQQMLRELTECESYNEYVMREKAFFEAVKESENELASKVEKILLPDQVESLEMAAAYRNVLVYGPVVACLHGPIANHIGFSQQQKIALASRSQKERNNLIERTNQLERKIVNLLSADERREYEQFFGKPVSFQGNFWMAVVCARENQRDGIRVDNQIRNFELK